jgi:hypothetical protein
MLDLHSLTSSIMTTHTDSTRGNNTAGTEEQKKTANRTNQSTGSNNERNQTNAADKNGSHSGSKTKS